MYFKMAPCCRSIQTVAFPYGCFCQRQAFLAAEDVVHTRVLVWRSGAMVYTSTAWPRRSRYCFFFIVAAVGVNAARSSRSSATSNAWPPLVLKAGCAGPL